MPWARLRHRQMANGRLREIEAVVATKDSGANLGNVVSVENIAKLAHRLLDPGKLTFVVVGRPAAVTPTAPAPQI